MSKVTRRKKYSKQCYISINIFIPRKNEREKIYSLFTQQGLDVELYQEGILVFMYQSIDITNCMLILKQEGFSIRSDWNRLIPSNHKN